MLTIELAVDQDLVRVRLSIGESAIVALPAGVEPLAALDRACDVRGHLDLARVRAQQQSREPTGEHQYYAGLNLQRIYQAGRAADDDLPAVRELAIAAFTSVLTNFPESVTYDTTGTIAFNLATPAYQGIVDLGGVPRGWTLVTTSNGVVAVKTHEVPPPLEDTP